MGGGGYGQNIAAGVDASSIMSVITDMFYNGEEWQFADAGLYGQANPDMSNFESWGHFSQLVWKDTTHVACYTTTVDVCPTIYSVNSDGSRGDALSSLIPPYFTVCNYKNPGTYSLCDCSRYLLTHLYQATTLANMLTTSASLLASRSPTLRPNLHRRLSIAFASFSFGRHVADDVYTSRRYPRLGNAIHGVFRETGVLFRLSSQLWIRAALSCIPANVCWTARSNRAAMAQHGLHFTSLFIALINGGGLVR